MYGKRGAPAYRSHLVYISTPESWSSVFLCMHETKLFFPRLSSPAARTVGEIDAERRLGSRNLRHPNSHLAYMIISEDDMF